ncbi:MAG TPA: pyridoxal phosphate-dependent aminotransferase [Polyangiaceae bacterium]|jgi:alanine-synthesizing transaminase|nr:pyridoxal phosphate-dependent aminotransferase [Polyangiaceae bacterium]
MATFSRRTAHDSEPNVVARALRERREAGKAVCDLTESNPTRTGLPYDETRLLGALADPRGLRYSPEAFGLASARSAVQALQRDTGFEIPLEHILLTSSTSEAYSFLFKLLCDPGNSIAIPRPSYPLFEHLATLEGVRAESYALAYDGAWHIDFEHLNRVISPETRAIVVVSPNNPTGSFLKRDELDRLTAFGLPIISDEVFSSYALGEDARRVRSVLETDAVPVFALGGLSKLAALPQMKLAWTCFRGPASWLAEAVPRLELVADTFLSPGTPVQWALREILAARAPVERALNARIRHNFGALLAALAGSAITPLFLEGGWYATLRLPSLWDEATWVLTLLNEDGVLTQPGWFYDFVDGPMLVLSLITSEPEFALGVARIAERVRLAVG